MRTGLMTLSIINCHLVQKMFLSITDIGYSMLWQVINMIQYLFLSLCHLSEQYLLITLFYLSHKININQKACPFSNKINNLWFLSVSSQGWSLWGVIYHCIIWAILIRRCVSDWPLWYCNQWSPFISESLINNVKVCLASQFENNNFH